MSKTPGPEPARTLPGSPVDLAALQRTARIRSLVLLWLCTGDGEGCPTARAEGLQHLLTRYHRH